MLIQCKRDGLLSACQLVQVAAASRTTKPILSNVKAIAEEDRLTLIATDLEIGIRYELRGVDVEQGGEAIMNVGRLVSILRESQDGNLSIDADERRCKVHTSSSEYEMASEDPADFPDLPIFADSKFVEVTAEVLASMIRRTVFAAAKQDTKFAITGILWEVEDNKLRLVATDTKRLALTVGDVTVHGDLETKGQSHLVPTKAMALLDRTLAEGDKQQTIRVSLRANEALFQTEKSTIYTRLVEGRYPPYRDIIPKKAIAKIPLIVEPFMAAVRQAAIMTDDETKKVAFSFAPGKLTLQAQGSKTGRSKVETRIEHQGGTIDINFDPQFLVEMLRVLDPAEVLMLDLVDGNKPALFRSGEDYLYLVMPLA
jgi:DNA polymerase III subunit beta